MAKVNPQVERLELEVRMLKHQIERMRQDPGDIPFVACDHSCAVVSAVGVAPNGGCWCDERKLRSATLWWRRRAQFLQVTIQDMRQMYLRPEAEEQTT